MGVLSGEEKHRLVPKAIALLILKCLTEYCRLPVTTGGRRWQKWWLFIRHRKATKMLT